MVLYGPSGVGKTSFAAEFEDVAFVVDPHEKGIFDLLNFGQCPEPKDVLELSGWEHGLQVFDKLSSRKGIKTVAIDSLTGFQMLCFKYHCEKYFNGDWSSTGFTAFQSGPKNAASRDWPELISALENLRDNGKNVLVLAHSQIKPFQNPSGANYDRYVPYLEKDVWAATHRWATAVLFYKFHIDTRKEGAKHKGDNESQRRLICTVHEQAEYDAKNRYGLDPIISAGLSSKSAYDAFIQQYERDKR